MVWVLGQVNIKMVVYERIVSLCKWQGACSKMMILYIYFLNIEF